MCGTMKQQNFQEISRTVFYSILPSITNQKNIKFCKNKYTAMCNINLDMYI